VKIAVVEWLRMQLLGVEIAGWNSSQYFFLTFLCIFLTLGDCSIRVSQSCNLHKVDFLLVT